jgi:REP element-mobilizing transposase RayT
MDRRDREHFVELLAEVVDRYGIILHAYVLMGNHYHLLIETPHANASRALQWLNLSYSVWHNVRHRRSGALFQARFKGIPVENEGSWALTASIYLHLNPVRIKALGQGKGDRAAERSGIDVPVPTAVLLKRLDRLRGHKWSSYPVYAGYVKKPGWLTCSELWRRASGGGESGAAAYRRYLEEYVKQGAKEDLLRKTTAALAIGSTLFVEGLRKRLPDYAGEQSNEKQWRQLLPFEAVRKAVESVKGEPWESFVNRRGDPGRDLALYYARQYGGFTLHELGGYVECGTFAVSKAVSRIRARLQVDRPLQRTLNALDACVKSASGAKVRNCGNSLPRQKGVLISITCRS